MLDMTLVIDALRTLGFSDAKIMEVLVEIERAKKQQQRVDQEWRKSKRWFVYQLVDGRTNGVFYIGVTVRPAGRRDNHRFDPGSAAYPRIQEILQEGGEFFLEVIAEYSTQEEAWAHEHRLINTLPNLANRNRTRFVGVLQ